jgi:hypothetical protein
MKKIQSSLSKILIVPVLIITLNILTGVFGFITQTPAIGSLIGATAAFMTDPIIILFAVVFGVTAPKSNLFIWIVVFFGGPIILVLVLHFILNTPYLIFDFFRLNSVMIIVSIVYLIKYKLSK